MLKFQILFLCLYCIENVIAVIAPIKIKGKHFYNSITGEPFFIKGIDYQPGGSSQVNEKRDPLSDSDACTRDIILFQELGINTVRIYSINPSLNHDFCMSLLATAGIYLILDVNSPMINQHLNRYEPWTTYNTVYLEHVFKVLQQFSGYNNTLGFFAGNEIINDSKSAENSPIYIKKLISDMKAYINQNSEREIPIGYSAADDLTYRVPLSNYLQCNSGGSTSGDSSVDFYGVNSYQWCGKQTMETSGYNELVDAYKDYTKPVFLSEFGCNKVLPRQFGEIEALYSTEMTNVFSGGLVYEFTQESNNYGLIKMDDEGDVQIMGDFKQLQSQYNLIKLPTKRDLKENIGEVTQPNCEKEYKNIDIKGEVPKSLAKSMIDKGVNIKSGKYVSLDDDKYTSKFMIYESNGNPWEGDQWVHMINSLTDVSGAVSDKKSAKEDKGHRKKNDANHFDPVREVRYILLPLLQLLIVHLM